MADGCGKGNVKADIEHSVGSKLCVVMFYDDGMSLVGDFTSQLNLRYCQRQWYDFRVFRNRIGKLPYKSKAIHVQECLKNYEFVFWIDADAEFTNHHVRLETFDQKGAVLMICRNQIPMPHLNSGAFMLRNHPLAFAFLSYIGSPVNFAKWTNLNGENAEVNFLANRMGRLLAVFPERTFNSKLCPWWSLEYNRYDTLWHQADFVAHASGPYPQETKLEMLRSAAAGAWL